MPNEYVYTPPALMSLSNPDTVVTEERLYQFYQQILPYLGGMPDILANKFSKADLYSTDEKLIGRWIDGKPIYQKTVSYNNTKLFNDYTTLDMNTDPIKCVINAFIVVRSTANADYDGSLLYVNIYPVTGTSGTPSSEVRVYETGTWNASSDRTIYLTVCYTKVGDSAVEIGSDTDYSTTEKIVGTWIDGKPIWQKTVDCGALPNSSAKNIVHNISNIDSIVGYDGITMKPSDGTFRFIPTPTGSDNVKIIGVAFNRTQISIWTVEDWSAYTKTYITLRYTKTSS